MEELFEVWKITPIFGLVHLHNPVLKMESNVFFMQHI